MFFHGQQKKLWLILLRFYQSLLLKLDRQII
jgi:hypothetical protein